MNVKIIKRILEGFFDAAIAVIMVAAFAIIPFSYGQALEERLFPVISNASVTLENVTDTQTTYSYTFTKNRDCIADTGLTSWYLIRQDGVIVRAKYDPPFKISISSRPIGVNLSRPWVVFAGTNDEFVRQRLEIFYRCHSFWLMKTVINIPIGTEQLRKW